MDISFIETWFKLSNKGHCGMVLMMDLQSHLHCMLVNREVTYTLKFFNIRKANRNI